jgi:excisionase family DNA binding protein
VEETATYLRTSRKAIYAMAERGQLPGVVRLGRRLLVRRTALERLSDGNGNGVASRR